MLNPFIGLAGIYTIPFTYDMIVQHFNASNENNPTIVQGLISSRVILEQIEDSVSDETIIDENP